MNPLLRKEIRLVLPAWLAVLLLEMGLPWIVNDQDAAITYAPGYFFFGMVLLAVDSFGREFSLGTFSSLMAQPLERRQVWRTKLAVLLAAAALIFAAYFISCELRLQRPPGAGEMRFDPRGFAQVMVTSGAVLLVALTGGLWTALLLRQISAALWIAWLAPVGLLLSVIFIGSLIIKAPSNLADNLMLYGAAGFYIVSGFWLAHRLFFRAEDAGWTGGVVSLSRWRYFERAGQTPVSRRVPRSLAALVKKEFQLHGVSLLLAAALLGLHLVIFMLRAFYSQAHPNSLAAIATDGFWLLWLLLPLVIGCMTVAEERKLGVMEEQFCLPMTRRRQFSVKLAFALVWGVLLGGVMPLLLETAARRLGVPNYMFKHPDPYEPVFILPMAAGLAGAGFFASTLARSFLQALSIAMVGLVGGGLLISYIGLLSDHRTTFLGLMPIPWILWFLLGKPTFLGVFLWLSYRNFTSYQEGGRLWRRNIAGLLGAGLFVVAFSALLYVLHNIPIE